MEYLVNVSGRKLVYLGRDTTIADLVREEIENENPGLEDIDIDTDGLEVEVTFGATITITLDESDVEDLVRDKVEADVVIESIEEV